ncbi:hypothetical protein AB0B66_23920 [Catellatospora sp. NPDC049111]|uniref:hypothetical protein n=1 Tax=Catellatospora sp. NPDC049111 TaxID=3155271 RepID=UPI0033F1488E
MSYVVLVTGVSGSGKSALSRHLSARGEHAISLDGHPGLCQWQDQHGRHVQRPVKPNIGWLRTHHWAWRPTALDTLIAERRQAGHRRSFLCGTAGNQHQLLDRFDLVVTIDVDAATMSSRLDSISRSNPFGRVGASRRLLAERFESDRAAMLTAAHHVVDATAPVEVVANMVCALAALHQLEVIGTRLASSARQPGHRREAPPRAAHTTG